MKHPLPSLVIRIALLLLASAVISSGAANPVPVAGVRELDLGQYQAFIANWDTAASPVLAAVIAKPEHWDLVLHPAPVMGASKPFAPKPEEFNGASLLLVSRVIKAPDLAAAKAFALDRVELRGDTLEYRWKFAAPASSKSFSVSASLAVWVPKGTWKNVAFYENGKLVATIPAAGDSFCYPSPAKP